MSCGPCQRQLQSYISMRSLIARIEAPPQPEDMVLETRVRLSQARNHNFLVRLENRLNNLLKPLVVPSVLGICMTMLMFGILLGSFASQSVGLSQDRISDFEDPPVYRLFQPVRTENPNWIRFAANDQKNFDLTIETHVGNEGRVIDFEVISGPQSPEVNSWIRQVLSLAQFTPATAFGKPVESRMILSFIAVRN
jgi:hypothetical protein